MTREKNCWGGDTGPAEKSDGDRLPPRIRLKADNGI